MSEIEVRVFDDPEAAAGAAAKLLAEAAVDGAEIALTGGSTPGRAYELASALQPDWRSAALWWGDERCVSPRDERSNFGLARDTLLEHLQRQPREIHRIRGELEPAAAAAEYERELEGVALDLVLLGLGPDGHVASLFPNEPSLAETRGLVLPTEPKLAPFVPRVSLTLPALNAGRHVVFLVTGAGKADAVGRALEGPPSPMTPGSLVRGVESTVAVLDAAASSQLRL